MPSWPASGDVLMPTVIDRLGSSTVNGGNGRGSSTSASVSPIVMSGKPAIAMMSPGPAGLGVDAVERFGHVELGDLRLLDRPVDAAPRDLLPALHDAVAHAAQIASRPTYGDASRLVTIAWNG